MSALLVISSAPATRAADKVFLDKKFVEGMRLYSELWHGPVSGVVRARDTEFAFGKTYAPDQLPFDVKLLAAGDRIGVEDIAGYDTVLCCGDNHEYLHVAELCGNTGTKIIYSIEYIAETRRQIIFLDRSRSLAKKLYSTLWTARQERRRCQAFHRADGVQANGYPAFEAYTQINRNTMMYLDNRIDADLFGTQNEMNARRDRLLSGAPLRLVHSGRLEPLKGSQDLVAVAHGLVAKGVDFELDIFGVGSLEAELRANIKEAGLQDRIRLNGVVDFETELVPFARTHADIYLSCHRQSDPSCTYIESMGCGLAIVGYSNRMWSALCQSAGAGWAVPLGNAEALADAIAQAAGDRQHLAACCDAAWRFAGEYLFHSEFQKRITHLAQTVQK